MNFTSLLKKIKLKLLIRKNFKRQKSIIELPFSINKIENLIVEPYTYIGPGAIFTTYGLITIKQGSILGPRIKIHTGNHNYKGKLLPYDEKYIIGNVIIEENVWIGSDVIILPGVVIGEGSVIGAGSVVVKSIPSYSIAAGNPAKILKSRNVEEYNKLKFSDQIYLKKKYKN